MCRDLRVSRGLKQRDVAAVLGIRLSTYGNLESSPHKVIRKQRAEVLSGFYGLGPEDHARMMDAWERCPLSPYGEKRKGAWDRRNSFRSKAKNHDAIKLALVNLLGAHLMAIPDSDLCSCEFGGEACPTCAALESVGLQSLVTRPDRDGILQSLSKIASDIATVSA